MTAALLHSGRSWLPACWPFMVTVTSRSPRRPKTEPVLSANTFRASDVKSAWAGWKRATQAAVQARAVMDRFDFMDVVGLMGRIGMFRQHRYREPQIG